MSWTVHAAHSSSRSIASPGCRPGGREVVEQRQRERRDVRRVVGVDAVLAGQVPHRPRAHVVDQRRVGVGEQALEEHALAQPRLGHLDAVEAARRHDPLDRRGAGEDQVAALGLDAGHAAALGDRHPGQQLDQLVEHVELDHVALDAERRDVAQPLRRRGEVARGAAERDQAPPRRREPRRGAELLGDVRAQRLELLSRRRLAVGQEALAHPHRAERPRAELRRQPPGDADELQRAAAEVEHRAVGERRRVDGGEVAVVGLLLGAQHAYGKPRDAGHRVEELIAVGRVADRAGGDDIDVVRVQAAGAAEAREHLDRRQRAVHRLAPQACRSRRARRRSAPARRSRRRAATSRRAWRTRRAGTSSTRGR